jgi:hypothetical protein
VKGQTSLRLDDAMLALADKLVTAMSRKSLKPLNRSDVLRIALEEGLKALARRYR